MATPSPPVLHLPAPPHHLTRLLNLQSWGGGGTAHWISRIKWTCREHSFLRTPSLNYLGLFTTLPYRVRMWNLANTFTIYISRHHGNSILCPQKKKGKESLPPDALNSEASWVAAVSVCHTHVTLALQLPGTSEFLGLYKLLLLFLA